MTTRDEHDIDWLDEQTDPDMEIVVDDLDRLYAVPTPQHLRVALDHAIYQRLTAQQQVGTQTRPVQAHLHTALGHMDGRRIPDVQPPQKLRRVRSRRAIVAAALLAAVVFVGGAYAAGSLVDQLLSPVVLRYSQSLRLSQSGCGFTMTITRAYLDGSRAVIGYTLSGPAGRTFINEQALPFTVPDAPFKLTTAQGTSLFLLQALSGDVTDSTQGQTLQFDAGSIPANSSVVPLRLDVPYIAMAEQLTGGTWATSPCETYRQDTYPAVLHSGGKPTRVVAVKGPFVFNLQAPPLSSRREADLHAAIQAGGERVVLDRVVVTPTDTRVYLWRVAGRRRYAEQPQLSVASGPETGSITSSTGAPPQATYEGIAIPDPNHDASGRTSTDTKTTRDPAGIVEYDFLRAPFLYDYHGPWTLVVPTQGGSVTFHFTVGDAPTATGTLPAGTAAVPNATAPPVTIIADTTIPTSVETPTSASVPTSNLTPSPPPRPGPTSRRDAPSLRLAAARRGAATTWRALRRPAAT